nr:Uma2 family endonuclease [Streptomyces justiciae]
MTPYSAQAHHLTVEPLQRRLYEVIPEAWGVYQRLTLAVPSRLGLYVPDLAVVPERALRGADDTLVPAGKAHLVVEVTSTATADNDRIHKARGYAEAGIPLYLLIDAVAPGGPTVTLYGEPGRGVYRLLSAGKFGSHLVVPQPFDLTLDTSEFPER